MLIARRALPLVLCLIVFAALGAAQEHRGGGEANLILPWAASVIHDLIDAGII